MLASACGVLPQCSRSGIRYGRVQIKSHIPHRGVATICNVLSSNSASKFPLGGKRLLISSPKKLIGYSAHQSACSTSYLSTSTNSQDVRQRNSQHGPFSWQSFAPVHKNLLRTEQFNGIHPGIFITTRSFSVSTMMSSSSDANQVTSVAESVKGSDAAVSGAAEGTASASSSPELVLDFLPEKPVPLDPSVLAVEPSFESLGLANWWPTGRVQYFMEQLHVSVGLEWYQAIAVTSLCLRLLTFPFVVMAQRNVANMNNHMPGMAALQEKMTDARKRGDTLEVAQYGQELQNYMKKKGINPIKNVAPVLIQLPIFMSMFLGLRGMANLPVPSMENGGLLWFENLTMADPFYLLPIFTSATLYLQMKMGADGNRIDSMGPMARVFFTVFPFVLVPITMNFPGAVTYYWLVTNSISCAQAAFLRVPAVRKKLNIPQIIRWDPNAAQGGQKKGFRESFRESLDNFRVQSDIADRRALDEQAFKEAGSVKAPKTYKYDPTRPVMINKKK